MTYKTLAKICAAISILSIAYMYVITYEGIYFGWIVFFVFLVFAILFNALDEQEKEIAILRSPKEGEQAKDGIQEINPRNDDPFSSVPDDPTNPRRQLLTEMQKEMTKERREKEANSSQNQDIRDSSEVSKSEIIFIPTWHTWIEKQWGTPHTAEQLSVASPKRAPSTMKRLIALISTEGKTAQQITKEGWVAFQRYAQVKAQVKSQQKVSSSNERPQEKQTKPGEKGKMQVIFRRESSSNPKNNDKN